MLEKRSEIRKPLHERKEGLAEVLDGVGAAASKLEIDERADIDQFGRKLIGVL
jgi:hypothetical protein